LTLPDGAWFDGIGAARFGGRVPAVELFANMPVALLERVDD
jgi:(1->4)-alpha-D-glucan 1-alpha-D-glucosylmutase